MLTSVMVTQTQEFIRLVMPGQVQGIADRVVRMAEAEPEWRLGKAFNTTFTVDGIACTAGLDFRPDGYRLWLGLEGEVELVEHCTPHDGQNKV